MSRDISQWMPIYWGDYHADTGHLSTAEHGAYMLLIGHYWTTGKPLTADNKALMRVTRMAPREWEKSKETILAFFVLQDGCWHHKRIDAEIKKQTERYNKRADAAKKRWDLHDPGKSNADAMHVQPDPDPKPNGLEKPLTQTLPPLVSKSGGFKKIGGGLGGVGALQGEGALVPQHLRECLTVWAPGLDPDKICDDYAKSTRKNGMPKDLDAAFPAWVQRYVENRKGTH